MNKFCVHHGQPMEREDGYMVLPCKKFLKVCGFKLRGAHYCPDVELLPIEVESQEKEDCQGEC